MCFVGWRYFVGWGSTSYQIKIFGDWSLLNMILEPAVPWSHVQILLTPIFISLLCCISVTHFMSHYQTNLEMLTHFMSHYRDKPTCRKHINCKLPTLKNRLPWIFYFQRVQGCSSSLIFLSWKDLIFFFFFFRFCLAYMAVNADYFYSSSFLYNVVCFFNEVNFI